MTITEKEAARILDPETSRDALLEYEEKDRPEACNEACRVATAALRAQSPKLDRSRWEKFCYLCGGATYLSGDVCFSGTYFVGISEFDFCPVCGKPLTEEAWAELERRIGGPDETD